MGAQPADADSSGSILTHPFVLDAGPYSRFALLMQRFWIGPVAAFGAVCAIAACASETMTTEAPRVDGADGASPDGGADSRIDEDAPTENGDAGSADAPSDSGFRTEHKCGPGASPPVGGVCTGAACFQKKIDFVYPGGMAVLHKNGSPLVVGFMTTQAAIDWTYLPPSGMVTQVYYSDAVDSLSSIAVTPSNLYWVADGTSIWESDIAGKKARMLVQAPAQTLSLNGMAAAGGRIFWNGVVGSIRSCDPAKCTGTQTDLAPLGPAQGLTASATALYWSGPNDGNLNTANLDGTGFHVLASGIAPAPIGVAVDQCHLYWWTRQGNASISRCSLADCANTRQLIATLDHSIVIGSIAMDDDIVYLLDRDRQTVTSVQKP